jgi:hypothetical protein
LRVLGCLGYQRHSHATCLCWSSLFGVTNPCDAHLQKMLPTNCGTGTVILPWFQV